MKQCTICNKVIMTEEPQILAMGAYGTAKYLCDECSGDLEEATLGRDPEKIAAAMERIGTRLANTNPNKSTFLTVNEVMEKAAARAKLIKEGKYDLRMTKRALMRFPRNSWRPRRTVSLTVPMKKSFVNLTSFIIGFLWEC